MPRPRATIDTDTLILAFAAHGLAGVSADQLATDLGLAKPTLYAHGHTKQTLYRLALETEVERLLERLHGAHALTDRRSARDRAQAISLAILTHASARPHGLRLVTRAHTEPDSTPETAKILGRLHTWLTAALARGLNHDGLDASAASSLSLALWGATVSLATMPNPGRRPGRERLAAITAALIPAPPDLPTEAWPAAT